MNNFSVLYKILAPNTAQYPFFWAVAPCTAADDTTGGYIRILRLQWQFWVISSCRHATCGYPLKLGALEILLGTVID